MTEATGTLKNIRRDSARQKPLLKLTWDEPLAITAPYTVGNFSRVDVMARNNPNGYNGDMRGTL
jgi:hypothetical protein